MKEVIVKDNMHLFKEINAKPNERGYIGYTFNDAKRWASAQTKQDEKGTYFVRKGIKYYV